MEGFINFMVPGAKEGYKQYKVLPSLTIAQAILESGWGKHAPGFNLFGMKWTPDCPYDYNELETFEYVNGERITIIDKFRRYTSYDQSILDHAELFRSPRYQRVIESTNYIDACRAVQECGYATGPGYADLLIQIIEENNLQQYDAKEVVAMTAEESINYLAEKGRITDKDWHFTLLKVVKNQEFIYIKWAEDIQKLEG